MLEDTGFHSALENGYRNEMHVPYPPVLPCFSENLKVPRQLESPGFLIMAVHRGLDTISLI